MQFNELTQAGRSDQKVQYQSQNTFKVMENCNLGRILDLVLFIAGKLPPKTTVGVLIRG